MENKHTTDALISALRKSATNLEELQLQVSLGKAEAGDKIDEAKKSFKNLLNDAKHQIDKGHSKYEDLKGKIEHLEVQMALGKAEAKESFEEQKKKISHTIHDIENFFKSKFEVKS
jgi:vacuolar-type H+-ATPase subunit H